MAALDARSDAFFAAALRGDPSDDALTALARRVHPGLVAERTDGQLVVRPESRELSPIAERVAARAPAGAAVLTRRPRQPLGAALDRARRESALDFRRARFRAGFARGHLLELVVHLPGGSGSDSERRAAQRLVWDAVGERLADDWIGAVHVAPEPRGGPLRVLPSEGSARAPEPERHPLEALPETVDAAVRGVSAALPEQPAWAHGHDGDWVLLETEPEPDGEGFGQDDLILASTREPELLKCYLSGAPFSSARFSRHGETCFFLKFAAEGELESRFEARSRLEDACDAALVAGRAGRVTGGGLGLRYTYVNFVLSDLERAFDIVRGVAREAKLPLASWLLPFDDDLSAEWVEVWPDTPAPPGLHP